MASTNKGRLHTISFLFVEMKKADGVTEKLGARECFDKTQNQDGTDAIYQIIHREFLTSHVDASLHIEREREREMRGK